MAADADMEEEVRSDFAAQEVHDGESITATIIRPRFEFRSDRFTNEVKRLFEVPKSYCAVCCRLLYDTERRPMEETMEKALVDFLISKGMLWPVMYYRDKNGEQIHSVYGDFKGRRKRGMCQGPVVSRVVVCPCHGASGKNSIEVIKDLMVFINTWWVYPGDIPVEFKDLHQAAESFLSPIMVFCELTNSKSGEGRSTRAGYHFVQGRIGLYNSPDYLGEFSGTRGIGRSQRSLDSVVNHEEATQIMNAFRWLNANNNIFKDRDRPEELRMVATIPEVMRISRQEAHVDENLSGFRDEIMMPVNDGGPRTADEENAFRNLVFGVDNQNRLVKYSNARLMGYLFPSLYVKGEGFYSLNYPGIKGGNSLHEDFQVGGHANGTGGDGVADDVGQLAEDNRDEEDEVTKDQKGYSRKTLRAYAKFRLLSVDRRFAMSSKYILMLFDWVQKQTVFGYHNRRAQYDIGNKRSTAGDVRERSSVHTGFRYSQSTTVAVPASIRTGIKYKQQLYLRFSAIFEKFGTPELFGTYSCNDGCEGQQNLANEFHGEGTPTHKDPVLFVRHWTLQWQRFFEFVRTDWAEKRVGGLKAFCWVLEVQDRGTPHTHFCLWTKKDLKELIADNIISCSAIGKTQEQTELIQRHQVHRTCGRYCASDYQDGCRFGYPQPSWLGQTYFDEMKNRFVYHRTDSDSRINGYNIDLLRFGRVNMDLQYNFGTKVKRYMCKYITKQAAIHKATVAQDRNGTMKDGHVVSDAYVQNFHYRSVSITEAIMDLCSFNMSGLSHEVVYLDTSLPEKRYYLLKRAKDLGKLREDDEDIFLDDKWKKYRNRPLNVAGRNDNIEAMCYKEYFEKFHYVIIKSEERMYFDLEGKEVCRRSDDKLAVVRTRAINVTNSEDAFMHLLMLYWPTRIEVTEWVAPFTQFGSYQELASEMLGRDRIKKLAPGLLVVMDFGISPHMPLTDEVQEADQDLTEDQQNVFNIIKDKLESDEKLCQVLVTGAAGTGKSTLLRKVAEYAARNRFEVVSLAPSGVAAVNIRGQTIHSWFRIARMSKGSYFIGNPYAVRGQLIEIASKGQKPLLLVDEASMISGTLLSSMGTALSDARYGDRRPFGGVPIIFFGDFGQLGPVNKWQKRIDWFWKSTLYRKLERHDLIIACRQEADLGFKTFLDDIRRGQIGLESGKVFLEILENGNNGGIPEDAVRLMTHRKQVDQFNSECLGRLEGVVWTSKAEDNGGVIQDRDLSETIAAETGLVSELHIKVGAMVMCTSNISPSRGLVNGTVGRVCRYHESGTVEIEVEGGARYPIGKEYRSTGNGNHERFQFPLMLSWAITIHKSQSLTLPKVAVSLKNAFSSGQGYVAMSRVRLRQDLFILDCSLSKIQSVAHAVKVRLTKAAEEERGLDDVIKEIAEEDGSSKVDAESLVRRLLEEIGIIDFNEFESSND